MEIDDLLASPMDPNHREFTVEEALAIADVNNPRFKRVPSVSRTLADEVRRLQELVATLQDTIANDAHAITFQSHGQYRSALLRDIQVRLKAE